VKVETLRTVNNYLPGNITSPTPGQPVTVSTAAGDTSTFTMQWGLTYAGTKTAQVAFVRSATDASLITAVNTSGGWGSSPYNYGDLTGSPNAPAQDLNVVDPSGRKALVSIDPASNGVTRTFQ
jgi:hypothetical protein